MRFGLEYLSLGPLACALVATPTQAHAEIPPPVRAMIDAAIATGDPEKVKTVIELAAQTNPRDRDEIEAIHSGFKAERRRLADAEAARKREAIRSAGVFDNWGGRGELGATRSTGNTSETGVTGKLSLERKGIAWRHKLLATADYQRTDGETSKEQYLFSYEPNYAISDRLFAYGLVQYEHDRQQGFSSRISTSGGLGFRVYDSDDLTLSVKGGPAWRHTDFVGGGTESSLSALGALDLDWRFAPGLRFTQEASVYAESANSTLSSATGLEAKINGSLAARFSYSVEYDTDPPEGAVKTDTTSRMTLIYDF